MIGKNFFEFSKAGDSFGELQFLTNKRMEGFMTSMNFSTVYYLRKDDFLDVLESNPLDYVNEKGF
jgi:CRP-like cAMP-binding protein